MWGGDDPDCRKPMLWPELRYQPETYSSVSRYSDRDSVAFDHDLLAYYQKLFALRQQHAALREGDFTTIRADDANGIYAFRRYREDGAVMAIFKISTSERTFKLAGFPFPNWREALTGQRAQAQQQQIPITLAPRTAQIWATVE